MVSASNTSLKVIFSPDTISAAQAQTSSPQNSPPGTAFPMMPGMMNYPEQHFIVMMIPHHQGAIAMADLALERSQRPEVRALAESIKKTQTQEIEQMQSWYRQWYGADVPQWTSGMGMGGWNRDWSQWDQNWSLQPSKRMPDVGMHHNWGQPRQRMAQSGWQTGMGCMGMRIMLGNTVALQNASDFDRAFIEEMVPHHQMGVMMAQMVLANSDRPEIQKLAQTMIDTQTAEINQMQQWYQQWYQ
ncbi:MAG: DUF305 domain-containing protein [Cyanobacteriota bacterium]|nr:DUF305 domain-containing protein [Cyanobacteriota bacterium]